MIGTIDIAQKNEIATVNNTHIIMKQREISTALRMQVASKFKTNQHSIV